MSTDFIVLLVIVIGGFVALFWYLKSRPSTGSGPDANSLLLLQNQLNEITRTLDHKLGESTKAIQHQFGESAKIIRDVTERLTKLDETNKQVVNFADQLQSLQDI